MATTLERELYDFALARYARVLENRRRERRNQGSIGRVLIVPPALLTGSLGDEAMLAALAQGLKAGGASSVALASFGRSDVWPIPGTTTVPIRSPKRYASYTEAFRFANVAVDYDQCYFVGADILDGHYAESTSFRMLRLVAAAALTGTPAVVAGFSFNAAPAPGVVQAFRRLPPSVRLKCRDSVSRSRFVAHVGRPAELVADLAFMLKPASSSPLASEALEWTRAQRAAGRLIIGVNANPLVLRGSPTAKCEGLIASYAYALTALLRGPEKASFVLFRHDTRPTVGDGELMAAIARALPSDAHGRYYVVPTTASAAEVKAICGGLDLALSGRMHLAIACLGQSVPAGCLAYQGKFEGLYAHFGLEGWTITPEDALEPSTLLSFVRKMVRSRDSLRGQIRRAIDHVVSLALANVSPPDPDSPSVASVPLALVKGARS